MDPSDVEGEAVATYRRAGLDPERPASTFRIARALYGRDVIVRPPSVIGAPAAVGWVHDRPRIMLRRTVPDAEAQFLVGHELGHLILETTDEDACDLFGACLMAPRPAARALHRSFGWDLRRVADEVVATQTWAALRIAEATRTPLAAVTPQKVRVRGPEEWSWPSEPELRQLRPGPGLRKVRITDRRSSFALVADAD